jgi:hypothetical protein
MSKMKEFDNILDECLQRLLEGESIEACLSRYPEHAAELEPLLRAAQATLKATDIQPRPEFRDRARYQFQSAIREMPVQARRGFFTVLRPALVTIIVVAIVLLAGVGVVTTADNSLPGSPLYPVKLATESVRLALTPSALGRAELYARFANERVDEIIRMAENGDLALIEATTDRMNRQLMAVVSLTGGKASESAYLNAIPAPAAPVTTPPPKANLTTPTTTPVPTITVPPSNEGILGAGNEPTGNGGERGAGGDELEQLRDALTRQYYENIQALQDELEKAPEYLKPALRHAIEVAQNAYAEALASLSS